MAKEAEISRAASEGNIERVREILKERCIVLNKKHRNMRALTNACAKGYLEIVRLLLDSGIEINSEGDYPLLMACAYNHSNIVSYLLKQAGITYCPGQLLKIAALAGHVEMLALLVRYGLNINSTECVVINKQNTYDSALLAACRAGHVSVVDFLLAQDAIEVNQRVLNQGITPLMLACQHGHMKIVQRLLMHPRIEIDLTTWEGENALAIACNQEHEDIVECLLRHGANPNQINSSGRTVLMQSIFLGTDRISEKLIANSAVNYNAVDYSGCSVKQYAMTFQKGHLIKRALANPHHPAYDPRFYSVFSDAISQPDERINDCTLV